MLNRLHLLRPSRSAEGFFQTIELTDTSGTFLTDQVLRSRLFLWCEVGGRSMMCRVSTAASCLCTSEPKFQSPDGDKNNINSEMRDGHKRREQPRDDTSHHSLCKNLWAIKKLDRGVRRNDQTCQDAKQRRHLEAVTIETPLSNWNESLAASSSKAKTQPFLRTTSPSTQYLFSSNFSAL